MRYSSIPEALSLVVLQNRQDDTSPTLSDSSYAERCSDVYVLTGHTPSLSISAHGYALVKLFHLPSSHHDLANIQYDLARWLPTCPGFSPLRNLEHSIFSPLMITQKYLDLKLVLGSHLSETRSDTSRLHLTK